MTLQDAAVQAYESLQALKAENERLFRQEMANAIVRRLSRWLDKPLDIHPTTVPFEFDGYEFTGKRVEGEVQIRFRAAGRDLYDEEGNARWIYVSSLEDIGAAIVEDQEFRAYAGILLAASEPLSSGSPAPNEPLELGSADVANSAHQGSCLSH